MLDAFLPRASDASASHRGGPARVPARPPWLVPVRDLQFAYPLPREASVTVERRSESGRLTVARAEGKRFERRVLSALAQRFPFLLREPGFRFRDAAGDRVCFPDGVLRFDDRTVVVEIKHRGTQLGDAWWQLMRYYRPVLEAVWPADPVVCVAIVRRVDPALRVPDAVEIESIEAAQAPFNVMEWR